MTGKEALGQCDDINCADNPNEEYLWTKIYREVPLNGCTWGVCICIKCNAAGPSEVKMGQFFKIDKDCEMDPPLELNEVKQLLENFVVMEGNNYALLVEACGLPNPCPVNTPPYDGKYFIFHHPMCWQMYHYVYYDIDVMIIRPCPTSDAVCHEEFWLCYNTQTQQYTTQPTSHYFQQTGTLNCNTSWANVPEPPAGGVSGCFYFSNDCP